MKKKGFRLLLISIIMHCWTPVKDASFPTKYITVHLFWLQLFRRRGVYYHYFHRINRLVTATVKDAIRSERVYVEIDVFAFITVQYVFTYWIDTVYAHRDLRLLIMIHNYLVLIKTYILYSTYKKSWFAPKTFEASTFNVSLKLTYHYIRRSIQSIFFNFGGYYRDNSIPRVEWWWELHLFYRLAFLVWAGLPANIR